MNAPITASVWHIGVEPGETVSAGQRLMVLEAMKMEIAVTAPFAGVVEQLTCTTGSLVWAGQMLASVRPEAIA